MFKRILSLSVIVCFFLTTLGPLPKARADSVLGLPAPGTMISLSPAYEPVIIKGLTVHKDNPFLFDFIVDVGQDRMSGEPLKKEGEKLIKYFLASLAIPDKDLWVNLSPYEKNRMIPEALGQTDMGRDLLEQDYILKQITASLIYPEKRLGKTFWDKVYAQVQQMYGTTQVPVNTFNKVWIMADKAEVFEHNQTAFVVGSHLKVMLEEDYLALSKHQRQPGERQPGDMFKSEKRGHVPREAGYVSPFSVASQIVRAIILPELEKEVNTGKNFANLRQILNSLILANWYKKNLKQALLNQVYTNQSKVKGIDLNNPTIKQQIYEQYLKAYKKGVFNYIKEDVTTQGNSIPRKYFSGGFDEAMAVINPAVTTDPAALAGTLSGRTMMDFATLASTSQGTATTKSTDAAMNISPTPLVHRAIARIKKIAKTIVYGRMKNLLKQYGFKTGQNEGEYHKVFTKVNSQLLVLERFLRTFVIYHDYDSMFDGVLLGKGLGPKQEMSIEAMMLQLYERTEKELGISLHPATYLIEEGDMKVSFEKSDFTSELFDVMYEILKEMIKERKEVLTYALKSRYNQDQRVDDLVAQISQNIKFDTVEQPSFAHIGSFTVDDPFKRFEYNRETGDHLYDAHVLLLVDFLLKGNLSDTQKKETVKSLEKILPSIRKGKAEELVNKAVEQNGTMTAAERVTRLYYIGAGDDYETPTAMIDNSFSNVKEIHMIDPIYHRLKLKETELITKSKMVSLFFDSRSAGEFEPPATDEPVGYIVKVVGKNSAITISASFYATIIKIMKVGDYLFVSKSYLRNDVLEDGKSGLRIVPTADFGLEQGRIVSKDWFKNWMYAFGGFAADFDGTVESIPQPAFLKEAEKLPYVEGGWIVFEKREEHDGPFIDEKIKEDRFEESDAAMNAVKGSNGGLGAWPATRDETVIDRVSQEAVESENFENRDPNIVKRLLNGEIGFLEAAEHLVDVDQYFGGPKYLIMAWLAAKYDLSISDLKGPLQKAKDADIWRKWVQVRYWDRHGHGRPLERVLGRALLEDYYVLMDRLEEEQKVAWGRKKLSRYKLKIEKLSKKINIVPLEGWQASDINNVLERVTLEIVSNHDLFVDDDKGGVQSFLYGGGSFSDVLEHVKNKGGKLKERQKALLIAGWLAAKYNLSVSEIIQLTEGRGLYLDITRGKRIFFDWDILRKRLELEDALERTMKKQGVILFDYKEDLIKAIESIGLLHNRIIAQDLIHDGMRALKGWRTNNPEYDSDIINQLVNGKIGFVYPSEQMAKIDGDEGGHSIALMAAWLASKYGVPFLDLFKVLEKVNLSAASEKKYIRRYDQLKNKLLSLKLNDSKTEIKPLISRSSADGLMRDIGILAERFGLEQEIRENLKGTVPEIRDAVILEKLEAINGLEGFLFDQAMVNKRAADKFPVEARRSKNGGIDLNTNNIQWGIHKDGNGVEINVDPAMIERIRREGIDSLSPVIFRITPVTNIWPLVGLQVPVKE